MRGLVWGVFRLGACVCGVCECVRSRGEKVSLAPLYYPDTLVNPDTCLGSIEAFFKRFFEAHLSKQFSQFSSQHSV